MFIRQPGSHRGYQAGQHFTTVPMHGCRDIPAGTLRSIERDLEPEFGVGVVAVTRLTYRVVVRRNEDGTWLADIPDQDGAHTFAHSLTRLDQFVHEVVVLAAGLPDDVMPELQLIWKIDTGHDSTVDKHLDALRADRIALRAETDRIERETTQLAGTLEQQGVSIRDSAVLLGVSPARVNQLTAAGHRKTAVSGADAKSASRDGRAAARH